MVGSISDPLFLVSFIFNSDGWHLTITKNEQTTWYHLYMVTLFSLVVNFPVVVIGPAVVISYRMGQVYKYIAADFASWSILYDILCNDL